MIRNAYTFGREEGESRKGEKKAGKTNSCQGKYILRKVCSWKNKQEFWRNKMPFMSAIIAVFFFLGGLQGDVKSGQAENGQGKLKF